MMVKDVANFLDNVTITSHLLVEFMGEDGAFVGNIYCKRFDRGVYALDGLYPVWRNPVQCLDVSTRNGCIIVRFILLKGDEEQ